MKPIISKILFVALIVGMGISCAPDEYKSTYGYSPFVQVTTTALNVSENATPSTATVKVQYVGPTLTQDLTVNLGVTVDGPTADVTTPPTTLTIKAGDFTGSTIVAFANNNIHDGNKVVTIKITSTSSEAVVPATPLTKKDQAVVTIVDDDCEFDINEYVGSYNLEMVLANDFLFPADDYTDNVISLTLGDDPNTLVDSDFGFISQSSVGVAVPVTIELDPVTASANIVGDPFNFLDGSSTDNAVVAYNTAPTRRVFTNGDAPGQLSTCSKTFVVNAKIRREDGTVAQILTLTYVKQ